MVVTFYRRHSDFHSPNAFFVPKRSCLFLVRQPQEQFKVGYAMPSVKINNTKGVGLNLRQDQSTNSPSLGLYKNGSVVCVFGVSQTWCHVRTEDGNVGFMLRENLSPLLEYNRVSAPTGDELEGSWFGVPGDPITDDFMPGGNG